jgi:hypothetical protein
VMGAEREPGDPARAHVQHAIQLQLPFPGGDLGAVAIPAAVDPARRRTSASPDLVLATGPCPAAWSPCCASCAEWPGPARASGPRPCSLRLATPHPAARR